MLWLGPALPAAAAELFAEGLASGSGSTVGPDGALYVTEGAIGRVSRIDLATGEVSTFASDLPPWVIGVGGAIDVEFIGHTAYVLVSVVGTDLNDVFPGSVPEPGNVVGIYRIEGPGSYSIVADIGAYNIANSPTEPFDYFIRSGVPYAMDIYRNGFLVTDGHLNRVLWVTLDGEISEFIAFGNSVPTGLTVRGKNVYMAQAGPAPHAPGDGRIVTFDHVSAGSAAVASGAPLMVDVQFGRGGQLYGLAQGLWNGAFPGSPAFGETGELVRVNDDGTVTLLAAQLDIPTSMQLIGNDAYVVTLEGQVWKIEELSEPPFGY